MSMVFAGFMGAAKEDRIRREDLKADKDKDDLAWQRQLDLLDITDRKQQSREARSRRDQLDLLDITDRKKQEILDRQLGKEAAAFAKVTGSSISDVLPFIELYGGAKATELWQAGSIEFGSSTNAGYTPGDRDSFVEAMMPHALKVSEETGLDPRVVIAQSALETGWGGSAPNNNFFGIKSHGKSGGANLSTREVINGQDVQMTDSFRTYSDMGESAADYANFLKTNPRYSSMLAAPDLDSQIAALGASGYATDPNYAKTVASIAGSIALPNMPIQKAKSPLDDTGVGEGGMSFGEDTQMADLGFGSPTPLTMPEPLVDTNPEVTVSTSGMETQAVQTGPRLVRPQPQIDQFLEGLNSPASVQARRLEVQNNPKLSPEMKAEIDTILVGHLETLDTMDRSKTDLADGSTFYLSVRREDGTVEQIEATRSASGTFYEVSPQGAAVPVTGEVLQAESVEVFEQSVAADTKAADFDEEFRKARSSFRDLAKEALAMDELVKRNEGVLTIAGGAAASFVTRIGNEFDAATSYLTDQADENGTVTQAEIEQAINRFEDSTGISSGTVDQNAKDYAEFKARQLRFAYAFARVTNEQSGVGLSNTDFQNALTTISAGSSYDSFSNSLRSQVGMSIDTVEGKFGDFLNDSRTTNRMKLPRSSVYTTPFNDFLNEEGIADVVDWANGANSTPAAAPVTTSDNPAVNNIINSPEKKAAISAFEQSIDNSVSAGSITPQTAIKLRADYARKLGLDPQTYQSISRMGAN